MRLSVAITCLSFCLIGISTAGDAHASIRKETNIPAEGLGPALNALAKDRNFQIVYVTEEIANVRTDGAVGEFTTEEALKRLLAGTGLTFRYLDDKTVTIGSATTPPGRSSRNSKAISSESSDDSNANPEGKKSSSGEFRVAQVDQGANSQASTVGNSTANQGLSEIIVTAQKRSERLQDVPVPVTALSADSLLMNNTPSIQQYYSTVPGLNFSTDYHGQPQLSIRGINGGPGAGNPTVSVVVDDVPFGPSSSYGGDVAPVPDFDPADLSRIEVLRGPQGTLYGASSIGGLIKFVTADPSTAGFSGRAQADMDHVYKGVDLGYGVRGSANIPLSDSFAIRVSGFDRRDPGYIDNVVTGQEGVNSLDVYGGHLAALWKVADDWTVKLSAIYQHSDADGASQADPTLGDLKQSNIPGTGGTLLQTQAYSATIAGKLGGAAFTSLTGYNIFKMYTIQDLTPYIGQFTAGYFHGVSGLQDVEDARTKKFSQEFRVSLPIGQNVDWLLGVFYTHEDSLITGGWLAENNTTGAILGNALTLFVQSTYQEYAAFTDITVHFSEAFDVQFGGREGRNNQTYTETDGGGYSTVFGFPNAPAPEVTPEVRTKDDAFTYLVTPRFRISPDLMVYARLASGYRPGGPNATCLLLEVPCEFNPDRTQNYEIGVKGDVLDHAFTFDGSIYYIDWKNIQLNAAAPSGTYYTNAGQAKSQGVELSLGYKPLNWLTASGWVAYNEAVLTQAFPPTSAAIGQSGDRLPFSSRVSGNLSLQEEFPISQGAKAYVGEMFTYVGDRLGIFLATPERQYFPSYTQLDLNAGIRLDGWSVNAYLNNATDKRGVLSGGLGSFTPGFTYTRPRTIGLSVVKEF